MTQYPPMPGGPGSLPYGTPSGPPPKPGSITGVAIMAIVIGSIGTLCCGFGGLVGSVMNMANDNRVALPDGTFIQQDAGVAAFGTAIAAADFVTSVTLLIVGIGALSLKPWARTIGIYTSVAMIVVAIVYLVGNLAYVGPRTEEMLRQMQQAAASAPNQPQMLNFVGFLSTGTMIAGVIAFLLRVIAPALILMLWTKPTVKQWFTFGGPATGPATGYAGGYQQPPPGY